MNFFGKFRGWQKNGNILKVSVLAKKWKYFEKSGVGKKMQSFFESSGVGKKMEIF
jgi:hypothetical protein